MKLILYYDGKCPFCQRYADILKLKKSFDVEICDARTDLSWEKSHKKLQLDDGVIVLYDGKYYQGVEALDMLLSVSQYEGVFFSLQKWVFSNKFRGYVVYSCFKFFRKIALKIKGV